MARCDACGSSILFGGTRRGSFRFCNDNCLRAGSYLLLADQIPDDVVSEHVRHLHQGDCPKCGGPGPVDVHTSHSVWSALVLTSWRSTPQICCLACGSKSKLIGAASSMALGWWGFPFGLILTPIQVVRNIVGLAKPPDPDTPTEQLVNVVRKNIAAHVAKSGAGRDV